MATESEFIVRDATPCDHDRINEIYNWTIVDNHVSFDTEPWDVDRARHRPPGSRSRIDPARSVAPWLYI